MWDIVGAAPSTEAMVRRLLLGYLLATGALRWPGGDGVTEDDALGCYLNAVANHQVPSHDELCRRHPDLGQGIEAFFSSRGW